MENIYLHICGTVFWVCDFTVNPSLAHNQPLTFHIYEGKYFPLSINSCLSSSEILSTEATCMSAIVTTETEEGVTIESECIGKVYAPDEFDKNEWTVEGEPNTTLVINKPSTVELTCASIVNRIPDVINSRPGYVPTEEFGELNYRTKPLNEYVK